jgi:hypothetical protein
MIVWNGFSVLEEADVPVQRGLVCPSSARGTERYSQDLKAKNIPRTVSCTMALSVSDIWALVSEEMMDIGIAFWCFSSGSPYLKVHSSCCKRNPTFPSSSRAGLGRQCSRKFVQTNDTAPRTEP